jgi:hypothetical protein
MKRRGFWLVVTAIAALGLGSGLGAGAAAGSAGSPGSATSWYSERTVVISCLGRAEVRPGHFVLACADGNSYLAGVSWASWTPKRASGYGTQVENDCIPYCAAGHFHRYPVLVVLRGLAALRGNPGTLRYTDVTLIYPGARPPVFNGHRWVQGPATATSSLRV